MLAAPRALLLAVVAAVILSVIPTASADGSGGCVSISTGSFASGIGLTLKPGTDYITFGVRSGDPGDGVDILMTVRPSLCPLGFGFGLGGGDITDPDAIMDKIPGLPPLLPLP